MPEIMFYLSPSALDRNMNYHIKSDIDENNRCLVNFIVAQFPICQGECDDVIVVSNAWWRLNLTLYPSIHILLYPDGYLWGYSDMLTYDCLTQVSVLSNKIYIEHDEYKESDKDLLTFLQKSAKGHSSEVEYCLRLLSDQPSIDLYSSLIYSDVNVIAKRYLNNVLKKVQYFEYINYFQDMVVINAGVGEGFEIPYFEGLTRHSCEVYNIDPSGYDNLSNSARGLVEEVCSSRYYEIRKVLWDVCGSVSIPVYTDGGVLSQYYNNNMHDFPVESFEAITVDELVKEYAVAKVDLIKMDIEGAEPKALLGAINTIKKHRPQLAISIYHWPSHYWEIPIYLSEHLDDYSFYIGHYSPGRWEVILYALPN